MADKSLSERLQKSIIIYSAVGIFVIGVIVALVSIMPLYNHLKRGEERNLLFALRTRTMLVEEYLLRAKDIALQITSRTKAREKLEAYNRGEVSLDEFANFSKDILTDALNKAKEVVGISRLDQKGNLVVQVGLFISKEHWPIPEGGAKGALVHGPIALGDRSYLVVGAPIIDRQLICVGTDIVLFELSHLQRIVEDYTGLGKTGETVVGVVHNERIQLFFPLRENKGGAAKSISKNSPIGSAMEKAFHKDTGILLPDKSYHSPDVIAYGPIKGSEWGIIVKVNREEVYAPIHRQVIVISSVIVVLILLSTFGMVLLLRPLAGKIIVHTDELKREIQKKTVALQIELNERKKMQEQLVRSEKLAILGQLAGGVGHELRNPLGAIKNAAYFLNMALEKPEPEVAEILEILEKEVTTSERIISSLFDFARPRPPTRRKVNVNDLLKEVISRTHVPENIEVVSKLNEMLPSILADPDQLSQVFGNILINAIQAMPEGGKLTVKFKTPSPEWVAISFADTGTGIPEENLEKLFEPLFTTKAKGVGLGLALTKTLIEGHGGAVEVQSEVGKGSTFTVRLPIKGGEKK